MNFHGQGFFEAFKNILQVDEKWFYLCNERVRFFFYEGEKELHTAALHKGLIRKAMFHVAVGKPY